MRNNGGQYEDALRAAPKPVNHPDRDGDWLDQAKMLVMEYGEWYENAALPLLRRPCPAHGAPKPKNHRPV